jgi:hypothetical protein
MKDRKKALSNIQRVPTWLEKALDRLSRQNFLPTSKRPPIFDQIANATRTMRRWIADYRKFAGVKAFYIVASLCVKELANMINVLAERIKPVSGKNRQGGQGAKRTAGHCSKPLIPCSSSRKPHRKDHFRYKLCGFRQMPRRTFAVEGKREFPIRMVQCPSCRRRFSLVPSFLPREKHYCLNIIGRVFDKMLPFGASIQGALENLKLMRNPAKSRQTVLKWLRWMGTLHPAAIPARAGVEGSGYLQEDEGFEKEPDLRTYSVVMVDPANVLVWHSDCVDSVDEDTLVSSFEKFVEKIEFKVPGVTKDKWSASTNALKSVFKNIWIGFCRRLILKKHAGQNVSLCHRFRPNEAFCTPNLAKKNNNPFWTALSNRKMAKRYNPCGKETSPAISRIARRIWPYAGIFAFGRMEMQPE